jgi:hypothetical protein
LDGLAYTGQHGSTAGGVRKEGRKVKREGRKEVKVGEGWK